MNISDSPPGGQTEPSELFGTVVADRYRIMHLVSEGANTTVFDAADESTGRTVTVKLIRPEMTATRTFQTHFDEMMRRVSALSHPNIAALFDWGTTDVNGVETAFVVAEQLTGGSLRDMFDRSRQLSPSQALAVGLDACRALDYAHRRGFIHSELTPSKLVFGDDRRLRITDFGLARLLNDESWQQPDSVANHTAWYASPEQGLSQPIDGKTDVYALCLTMHEAVTGDLPFKKDSTVATLAARVGRLMPVSADLGPLAAVLEHAGRPDADERASAAEFGKGLVQTAGKLPRPEPLPLLSTGLFDTPVEQLRSPDDPTGGVVRPPGDDRGAAVAPLVAAPLVIAAADTTDHTDVDDSGDIDAAGIDDTDTTDSTDVDDTDDIDTDDIDAAGLDDTDTTDGDAAVDAVDVDATDPGSEPAATTEPAPTAEPDEPDVRPEQAEVAEPELVVERPVEDLVILPLDSEIGDTSARSTDDSMVEAGEDAVHSDADGAAGLAPISDGSVPTDDLAVATAPETQVMATTAAPETQATADAPVGRRRRGFPWKVLLALLVVAALVVLGILATRLFATPVYTVPDLVEMPEAEARNLVAPNQWEVTVERERSDVVPVAGLVVRTAPQSGVELAEGEPFLIVVSMGPTLRELPDSTGLPFSEAQTRLVERGLDVATVERFDEEVPSGFVIDWAVPGDATLTAGALVEPGTVVELIVSTGPEPRTIPNVVGLPVGAARTELESVRLTLTEVGQEFSDDVVLGSVISQGTPPGTEVPRGADLTVIVSRGPDLVSFPDLSAVATYEQAEPILVEAGFAPRLTFGDAQGAIRSIRIDGEEPAVGETFRRGTQVDITAL